MRTFHGRQPMLLKMNMKEINISYSAIKCVFVMSAKNFHFCVLCLQYVFITKKKF